jgi:CheY-like chemotaxis protein
VYTANSGEEALEVYENYLPDYVITDYHMSGMTGKEFLEKIYSSSLKKPLESWIMSSDKIDVENFIPKSQLVLQYVR